MRRPVQSALDMMACIAPCKPELGALGALIMFYFLADELYGQSSYEIINLVGPIWLAGTLGFGAIQMTFRHPAAIWTGLFWLRISTAVYFGFGAAIPFFVNDFTRSVIEAFHYADAGQMLKVNIITALGILTMLITTGIMSNLVRRAPAMTKHGRGGNELLLWGLLFGFVGVTIKYLYAVPYAFGVFGAILPGAVLQLSLLTSVAIYLIGSWVFAAARSYVPILTIFTGLEILIGLMSFSKTEVVFPLMMYLLAMMHTRVTKFRIAVVAVVAAICFNVVGPIVDYGRTQLWTRYQSIVGADFSERFEILQAYFSDLTKEQKSQGLEEFQAPMARLSYINQSAFAVHLYDSGIPGDTLRVMMMVAIPRFLWPDKPNLNFLGMDFNLLATNNPNSLSWPGQYAEAYWNLGWNGIPILFIPLGVIYFYISRYAMAVFTTRNWVYFPVVLLGMKFGVEIGSPYATAVVGGLAVIVSAHIGCWALDRFASLIFSKRVAV